MPTVDLEETLAGKFCRLRAVWHMLDEHEAAGACGQPTALWDEELALKEDIMNIVFDIKLAHATVALQ